MTPITVLCLFRVRPDGVDEFKEHLRRHWPALHGAGLVTDDPPKQWTSSDRAGAPVVIEMFSWKDASMAERAHDLPDVMAVWGPMGDLCEDRKGQMKMEFLDVEALVPGDAG